MNMYDDAQLAAQLRSRSRIAAPTTVSSAEVTSSHRISAGSAASARARFTRCFWPPDKSAGQAVGHGGGQAHQVEQLDHAFCGARAAQAVIECERPARMRRRVCDGFSAVSAIWKTIWMRAQLLAAALRDGSSGSGLPSSAPRRAPAGRRPAITRASVVLPQPDSPITPSVEPRADA